MIEVLPPEHAPPKTYRHRRFWDFTRFSDDSHATLRQRPLMHAHEISQSNSSPHELLVRLKQGVTLVLRRSWWGEIPRFVLLAIALVMAVYFVTIESVTGEPYLWFLPWVVPLTVGTAILHRRFNRRYVITYNYISIGTGFIALQLSEVQCGFDRIRSIEVRRTIFQRILGVGDIEISTALIDQPELDMSGVYNPFYYANMLREAVMIHSPNPPAAHVEDL